MSTENLGAPWTFNSKKLREVVEKLKDRKEILVPSFDHAVKDPVEDDIKVPGLNPLTYSR